MKAESLGYWFKEAGPGGPMLWGVDVLIEFLSSYDEPNPADDKPYEGNDAAMGVFVAGAVMFGLALLMALIAFFPH
jgi:hypothetical protein